MNRGVLFLFHCVGVELLSYAAYEGVSSGIKNPYFTFTLIVGLLLFFGANRLAVVGEKLSRKKMWTIAVHKLCELGLALLPSGITLLKMNNPLAAIFLIIPVLSAVIFIKYMYVLRFLFFRDNT